MVSITGVVKSMWDIMLQLVPKGVDPVLFYLTFILSLALIFVILQLIQFFREKRGTAFIIAVIIAYFTASSVFVTVLISKLFPNIGLAIMALLGIMLVAVFLSPNSMKEGFTGTPIIVIAVFIITMWLTWTFAAPELEKTGALGAISTATGFAIDNEDTAVIVFGIIVLFVLYMVFRTPDNQDGKGGKLLKWLTGEKW